LNWSEWETPEGGKRQSVEIVADTVQFLDGRGDHGGSNGSSGDEGSADNAEGGDDRELVGVGSGIEDELAF
jgi:single-strand DNA-binding protein